MKKQRRGAEMFSLSFLDVITCGFGAIILLLVISKTGSTVAILEDSPQPRDGLVRELQTSLFEIRGETQILNRDLNAKQEQISAWTKRVARLKLDKQKSQNEFGNLQDTFSVQSSITEQFESAKQTLTAEMHRLLAKLNKSDTSLVGGIPIDSEYIIFVIDTSGSMVQFNWGKMINQLTTTLDVYPNVKGLQIMSDMGGYLFSQTRGKWIPDTPGRRRAIISNLRRWNTFSNSSPVEGITRAIQTFSDRGKNISIYVYGDEFTGNSISNVVDIINKLNPKDRNDNPRIRIHGVGFPIPNDAPERFQITNQRFATLMREVVQNNAGTFVGLN
ncbi:MAG: VWA domain-containing protein [Gammaproteobacteria bacterium]|nr:VWA domain-containing protein [Gammaproteobacteria bacterium]